MNKELTVKCPSCKKSFSYYQSENRPFCSERCKLIDLGHWFKETYRVPLKVDEELNTSVNEEGIDDESIEESPSDFQENSEDEDYS
jgi:endogenous inhibitor of DNA gyrase (YacG/DUF329 family)